ncbi:DUF4489 domain-containing protein [Clostridium tertium]|uniref:DUF4489 domain-containing protein n=1 Tax=Clostridium tertium TaxID=1559 RepID=A0A6N3AP87_9CLOT
MNSMSRGYNDNCGKERKKEEEKCPTIVKCSCPSSTPINNSGIGQHGFIVASLTLDTSCICDPSIKLEFASNIVVTNNNGVQGPPWGDKPGQGGGGGGGSTPNKLSLDFRVFKQCKNQKNKIPVGGVWTFLTEDENISSTFSFFVCDSDNCDDECCTYTVVATPTSLGAQVALGGSGSPSTNVFVNNATLGAVATCRNSCKKCRKEEHY